MQKCRRGVSFLQEQGEEDPISSVANLFDVGMVFAVSLMVAMVSFMHMSDFLTGESSTIVKNPGQDNMEIIRREGERIERYRASENQSGSSEGTGRRVGSAYELENGEIIYIPE
ncbi:DUF2149 domain-containing protein [Chitinivibrio alkaliphilus]|uniref:DUF2149 domain-containing protein n=1 Tax=Chitinivibrio alkaliphilus ACht1 TaxID=1313304 RepID=U7D5K1_9BACT|nr:DUF2149 domain-containing protein [Chitinivibrio alkaliphilus]ERP31243.1 hypothetical protein CALK_1860 [Chitinivibrio alkaliphilus ACht1]